MNIIIKTSIELTPALEAYLQKKFSQLEKFVASLTKTNPAELLIDIRRTTKHHKKGEVYRAVATLRSARIVLRAEAEAEDIRVALDAAKDVLKEEIEKAKDKKIEKRETL